MKFNRLSLISQLLLHHVIPGYFEINSLQDEMTGVSLAGTQLRVNQYNMHDTEWNDVKVSVFNEFFGVFQAENNFSNFHTYIFT